jgi:hypothetical protein
MSPKIVVHERRGWLALVVCLLLLAAVAVVAETCRPARFVQRSASANADDNVVESFPVATTGELLLLPVTVGGKRLQFIVDTGYRAGVSTFRSIDRCEIDKCQDL